MLLQLMLCFKRALPRRWMWAVVGLLPATIGCVQSTCQGETIANEQLARKWRIVRAEGELAEESVGCYYTFEDAKARFTSKSGVFETHFTYTREGDNGLILNPIDEGPDEQYCLALQQDTLVMTLLVANYTFYLVPTEIVLPATTH